MKKLVCFYCNKRSDLRYDGQMTQWPCATCEAVNYLDENGEITDPPVATMEPAAPYDLRFAASRSDPFTAPISDSNPFCARCLKNQHLYTSSLQQYHLETDPTHPDYRESERLYYKYKKTLERTYPQVCEDCEPRVLERMRAATKTAQSDHLRRLMEKTRARRAVPTKSYTFFDLILFITKWLWHLGIAGQLLWNIMALFAILEVKHRNTHFSHYLPTVTEFVRPLITVTTSSTWARYSLNCSLLSMWWNPKFKELNNGFMNHITGFGDWYKLQLLHIVIRSLFYYTMGSGVFSDLNSPATAGAHTMVPIFVLITTIASKRALKVDMTPLWNTTPEKLPNVAPRSRSPSPGMASILDGIVATPLSELRQPSPPSAYLSSMNKTYQQQDSNIYPSTSTGSPPARNGLPPFRDIPLMNGTSYMSTRETSYHPQQEFAQPGVEEMEWTPTIPQTQARAFNPSRPAQAKPYTFGDAPGTAQPSPFYGRLPEAPITPAHRLRNPPNQARLRVPSKEVKENFFNNITRRGANSKQGDDSTGSSTKHEMNLSQQRFFPPTPPSEAGNVLADLLTSFSFSSDETSTPAVQEQRSTRIRHMWQALVLLLGLAFWNNCPSTEATKSVMLAIMLACLAIAVRTLLDNTVFVKARKSENVIWYILGCCIAGLELTSAGYCLTELLADRGALENNVSLGTLTIGGMLLYEIGMASFGR